MTFLAIIVLVGIWEILSIIIDNSLLLPSVLEVGKRMLMDVVDISFYQAILNTLSRMLLGLLIGCIIGSIFGILAGINKKFEHFMRPIELISQTVPNISYIILSLIWLGQEKSVILVSFLVLYPLFYNNGKLSIKNMDKNLTNVMRIYNNDLFVRFKRVYFPTYYPYLINTLHQSISLGFKVCVMAEILGQVPNSLGIQIHLARVNLDTAGVFSYTCWIIILVFIIDQLFKKGKN